MSKRKRRRKMFEREGYERLPDIKKFRGGQSSAVYCALDLLGAKTETINHKAFWEVWAKTEDFEAAKALIGTVGKLEVIDRWTAKERARKICAFCGGTGRDPHFKINTCPECRGSGESTWPY